MSDKIEQIIEALRKKILESAIRGELVPQNPDDEPASVLLERIAEEREKLIREKKIKKPKTTSRIFRRDGHFYESINGGEPTCIDDDIPFDIPDSWEWCRLTSVCSFLSRGKSPKYSETEKKYPVFAQKCNLKEGGISLEKARFLDPKTIEKWQEVYKLQSGDILINSTGTGTVCRTRVFNESCLGHYPFTVPDSHVTVVRTFNAINSFFVFAFVESVETQKYLEENLSGSTNQKELYIGVLENLLIPIPPAKEQENMVNEIASLFAKLETISISRRYYKRILSETPTSLRQQLIQSAIQGQLVPQNPNDEPASVLLERIAEERASKMGKKAVKSMSRIERRGSKTYELFPDGSEKDISDEIPFEIPSSWEWARLSTLLESCSTGPFGSMLHKSDYVDFQKGIPLINPTNIKEGIICSLGIQKVSGEKADCLAKYRLKEGDIILARRGDLSKCAVITKAESKWLCGTGSFFLHLTMIENAYFCCVYSSQYTQSILLGDSVGSTMQNLNQSVLNNLLMPIPPLQEQHRIVEKLDALLKLE